MSGQSDWEGNCPRAVLQYCITTSLYEGRKEREKSSSRKLHFFLLFIIKTRNLRGFSEDFKI